MEDLWPDDITPDEDLRAPAAVLKEQASLLGQKTSNLVKGYVEIDNEDYERYGQAQSEFSYNFFLVAPALGGYHFFLFDILYSIPFYPVKIGHLDDDISREIPDTLPRSEDKTRLIARDEPEFLKILGMIFKANRTKYILKALISQSGGLNVK